MNSMMKISFIRNEPLKLQNAEHYYIEYDNNHDELKEFYKNLYPDAEVSVNKEYEQSWVEDGYYEPDESVDTLDENGVKGERYIDCSYYEEIPYLNIFIEFKNEADEAEFIMRELS